MKICWMLLGCVLFLSSCAINRLNEEKTVVVLDKGSTENHFIVSVSKGPEWSHEFKPGPFIIHVYPQMVFWIENQTGELVETLYVSGADGKGIRNATKKQLGEEFYRICFPIWAKKVNLAGLQLPSNEVPYSDAVTSATPQSSFDLDIHMGALPDSFILYAEINKSMDWNENYTEEKMGWVGQPSIIYAAQIDSLIPNQLVSLKAIGYSNDTSPIPELVTDFKGIDTALELLDGIQVQFE